MSGAQRRNSQSEQQGATGATGSAPPAGATGSVTPVGPPATPNSTTTSPDGVTQNLAVSPEVVTDIPADFSKVDGTTVVEVVQGRAVPHGVRPEPQLGGTQMLAGEVYGGLEGAQTLLRKGAIKLV